MWWLVTLLMVLVSLIVGFVGGTMDVLREEYQIFLHWVWILLVAGSGTGVVGVLGYYLYIRLALQELSHRTANLRSREIDLDQRERRFWEYRKECKRRLLTDEKNMIVIDLPKEVLESALGKQLRQVEQALHEVYKNEMEKLRFENNRLRVLMQRDRTVGQKAALAGRTKSSRNTDRPKLAEGPTVKRHKS